jgi:protocatechuate 3,4-dioxygenase beta subunit
MSNQILVGLLVTILHCAAFAQTTQQKAMVIKGQVLDDQGLPVAGVAVTAYPDAGLRGKLPTATSDARGEFQSRSREPAFTQ